MCLHDQKYDGTRKCEDQAASQIFSLLPEGNSEIMKRTHHFLYYHAFVTCRG